MEGKVDKTIVKSILVAFGIIVVICIVVGTIIFFISKGISDSKAEDEMKEKCIDNGLCYQNGKCIDCMDYED